MIIVAESRAAVTRFGFILCFTCLCASAHLILAAPAPAPIKNEALAEKHLKGFWDMHWGSIVYETTLGDDRRYRCSGVGGGDNWAGYWVVKDDGVVIRERMWDRISFPGEDEALTRYDIRLSVERGKGGRVVVGRFPGQVGTGLKIGFMPPGFRQPPEKPDLSSQGE